MGQRQKTGGRKTGTPNKVTGDIKTKIAALVDEQFENVQSDLEQMEPKDRVTAYLKFLDYVLPRQREQKIDVTARLDSMTDEQLNSLIDQILTNP